MMVVVLDKEIELYDRLRAAGEVVVVPDNFPAEYIRRVISGTSEAQ